MLMAFTPTNVGKLFLGEDTLVSCTPKGIMQMLASTGTRFKREKCDSCG